MHVQQAQDLTLSVACICIMQGGEGHLVPVRLVFLDLEQLRRMQNFYSPRVAGVGKANLARFFECLVDLLQDFCIPRLCSQKCVASLQIVSSCNFGSAAHAHS